MVHDIDVHEGDVVTVSASGHEVVLANEMKYAVLSSEVLSSEFGLCVRRVRIVGKVSYGFLVVPTLYPRI